MHRGVQHVDDRRAAEGRTAGDHLEQNGSRREKIRPGVDRIAEDLLGRHVPRGADHDPAARQRGRRTARPRGLVARQSEIEQLDPMRGQKHVRRLQVAVNESAAVQGRERGQDALRNLHRFGEPQRSGSETLAQRFALEQLHGDEQRAAVLADLVNLADVRMIDAGRRTRLAPEA